MEKKKPIKFSFSIANLERIITLNNKLKKEEERIRPFANQLHLALKKQVEQKQMDDYNIVPSFSAFSNNAACNKQHDIKNGDPLWKNEAYLLFGKDLAESFYTDNWNELPQGHPAAAIPFCYTMHCLVFHSPLSWQDIVDVDEVWIELKVDYQFCVSMALDIEELGLYGSKP